MNQYTYGKDNLPEKYIHSSGKTITYGYDGLNRLMSKTLDTERNLEVQYTYDSSARNAEGETLYTTSRIKTETTPLGTFTYTYDDTGMRTSKTLWNGDVHEIGIYRKPMVVDYYRPSYQNGKTVYQKFQMTIVGYAYKKIKVGPKNGYTATFKPKTKSTAAILHTHGALIEQEWMGDFSPNDKITAKGLGVPLYLVSLHGYLFVYDPETDEETFLY